ncbi:MAG: hypothetical protein NZ749_10790 [bacterium]|nr:hypothetical protein [bacterium]
MNQPAAVAFVEVEYDYLVRQPASVRQLIANRSIAVWQEIAYFSDRRARWWVIRKVADFNRKVHRSEIIELHESSGKVVSTVGNWEPMSGAPMPLEWYHRVGEEYRVGKTFPTESEVRKRLFPWGTPRVVTYKGRRALEVRDETRGRHRIVDAASGIVLEESYRLKTGPWKPYQRLRRAHWVFADGREYTIELP